MSNKETKKIKKIQLSTMYGIFGNSNKGGK